MLHSDYTTVVRLRPLNHRTARPIKIIKQPSGSALLALEVIERYNGPTDLIVPESPVTLQDRLGAAKAVSA